MHACVYILYTFKTFKKLLCLFKLMNLKWKFLFQGRGKRLQPEENMKNRKGRKKKSCTWILLLFSCTDYYFRYDFWVLFYFILFYYVQKVIWYHLTFVFSVPFWSTFERFCVCFGKLCIFSNCRLYFHSDCLVCAAHN